MARVGERFSQQATLSEADILDFARLSGDQNPLHSDPAYAATTRYTRLVACAPHYTSLLMGLVSSEISREGPGVALEFTFNLLRPVLAGDTITLNWEVVDVMRTPRLDGEMVSLSGRVINQLGKVVLMAHAKMLLTDKL